MNVNLNIISSTIPAIKEALTKGAIQRVSVETNTYQRGIGKTTALVEFAKEHGLTVVVPVPSMARDLRELHDYKRIISTSEIERQRMDTKFVYDEGVHPSRFKIKDNVVTGLV